MYEPSIRVIQTSYMSVNHAWHTRGWHVLQSLGRKLFFLKALLYATHIIFATIQSGTYPIHMTAIQTYKHSPKKYMGNGTSVEEKEMGKKR